MGKSKREYPRIAFASFFSNRPREKFGFRELSKLFPFIKPHWQKIVLIFFLMLLGATIVLPTPYIMKYILDEIIPGKNIQQLGGLIILIFCLATVNLFVSLFTNYYFNNINQEILLSIKTKLLQRILSLPLEFFDKKQSGYLMSRVQEVQSLDVLFSSELLRGITGIIQFIVSLVAMFYLEWKLTLLALAIIPIIYFLTKFISGNIQALSKSAYDESANVSNALQESFSGASLIKTFAAEDQQTQKVNKGLRRLLQISVIRNSVASMSNELLMWIIGLVTLVLFWVSVRNIMAGGFTIGGYIAFSGYLNRLIQPITILASLNLSLQPSMVAINRIFELLEITTEEEDILREKSVSSIDGDIVFEDVTFYYGDNKEPVFTEFNMHIKPGECVAISGPSGSGKTTIARLILGLYRPVLGRVLVDGNDVNQLILSDLRRQIGIVSQNTFLFNDTVRKNILFSNPSATENDIINAAIAADAHEFILALPNGYDTIVGERGAMLSGGQIQRISLARVLLKNPSVVILDEATSQIDAESERRIFETVNKLFCENTRIIITHRLPRFITIDQIIKIFPRNHLQNDIE